VVAEEALCRLIREFHPSTEKLSDCLGEGRAGVFVFVLGESRVYQLSEPMRPSAAGRQRCKVQVYLSIPGGVTGRHGATVRSTHGYCQGGV
jgi:hypothetical protein